MLRGTHLLRKAISNRNCSPSFSQTLQNTSVVLPKFQVREASAFANIRRQKIRSTILKPVGDEDVYFIYPNERLGNTYAVNFQLAVHDMTAHNEVYRNLHVRGLLERAEGKLDGSKALHFKADGNKVTVLNSKSIENEHKELFKQIKEYISRGQFTYMHDGAIGSNKSAEIPVRIFTDSANAGLFLNHMIPKLPLREAYDFSPQLVVYHASSFKDAEKYGLKTHGFCIYDQENNWVVIGGTNSTSILAEGIVNGASRVLLSVAENNAVPLNCDVVTVGDSKTALVIGSSNFYLKQQLSNPIFGAHNAFWTPSGISRAWNGVAYPFLEKVQLQRGDLVETTADGSKKAVVGLQSPNVGPHPNSVVFLVSDTQGILPTFSKLSPVQASQHLLAGYGGKENSFEPFFGNSLVSSADPNHIIKGFRKLVEDNKVDVYMINTNLKGTEIGQENIQKLLLATVDGSAAGSKTGSGFTTVSPIASIASVKSMDGGNASKEQQFTTFLKTKFPSVTF